MQVVIVPPTATLLRPVEIGADAADKARFQYWNLRTRAYLKGKLR